MPDNWKQGVLLDIETSGTDPSRHQILTLDAVIIRQPMVTWEAVGQPFHGQIAFQKGAAIDPLALRVNGISVATWVGDTPAQVASALVQWVRDTAGDGYQMTFGYNLAFDLDFVRRLVEGARIRWTDAFSFRRLDVMSLALWAKLQGRLTLPDGNVRLVSVAKELGIPTDDAHDSAADVMITLRVMNRLLEDQAHGKLFA